MDPMTAAILANAVPVVASGFMTILGTIVAYYLPSILGGTRDSIKNEKIQQLLSLAEQSVQTVVVAAMQTTVDGIKKEGKWTPAVGHDIKNTVFLEAKRALQNKALWNGLVEYMGDNLDAWISAQIEATVHMTKPVRVAPDPKPEG